MYFLLATIVLLSWIVVLLLVRSFSPNKKYLDTGVTISKYGTVVCSNQHLANTKSYKDVVLEIEKIKRR